MPQFENTVPKNYRGVPRTSVRPGPSGDAAQHHRAVPGRYDGAMRLRLTTVDPVRVGRGTYLPLRDRVAGPVLLQDTTVHGPNDVPVLPGSSLKGTLRSLFEALHGGCDQPGSCAPRCVACLTFGYVRGQDTFMGRLGFGDALPRDPGQAPTIRVEVPRAFPPRTPIGRRIYGAAPAGVEANVTVVAVPRGVPFETTVTFRNLDDEEMGRWMLAAGMDGTFCPRVGGGKFYGLGRVRFEAVSARLRDGGYRRPPRTLEGAEVDDFVRSCLSRVRLTEAGTGVVEVLRAQMPQPAPAPAPVPGRAGP